jgi:hypothetical protein
VGRLRCSGYRIDGQSSYVLENGWGQVMTYVTPQPGLDLSGYVGKHVDLRGPMVYRGDIRANYMAADYVVPVP